PVFFVVSGLNVNLSSVGLSGLGELGLILLVAVTGKFGGAFAGARLAGLRGRSAGVLATLMNTRGLTGIVILSVGLQLHILDRSLYSLMIVMAVVTTLMAGPLLHFIDPDRVVERDIAEADSAARHRILVLIEAPETAAPLVEVGAALAASREDSKLILAHLEARKHDTRSEAGTGLSGELLEVTGTTGKLQELADRALAREVPAEVRSWVSQDIPADLPGHVAAARPDTIVLGPGVAYREALAANGAVQLVTGLRSPPQAPGAGAVRGTRGGGSATAVQVARQLAAADGLKLMIMPTGNPDRGLADVLARDGVAESAGPPPGGAIIVAADTDSSGDAHLTVLGGTREGSGDLDDQ